MIRAQMPDGTILEFPEGTEEEIIDRAAQEYIAEMGQVSPAGQPPEAEYDDRFYLRDLARETLDTFTLGFADEIGLGLAAAVASVAEGKSFGEVYDSMNTTYKKERSDFQEDNPKAALAAQVAGGLVSPASLALARGVRAATTGVGTVKAAAAGGAAEGAVYGAGSADGGLMERAKGAATGAGSGAVAGGTLGGVVSAYGKRSAENILKKAQADLYNKPVIGTTEETVESRLRRTGYSDAEINKVAMAQAKLGRGLDVPEYNLAQVQAQNLIAKDSAVAREGVGVMNEYLGVLSTRIKSISEPVWARLRKFEADVAHNTNDKLKAVDPFLRQLKTLDQPTQDRAAQLLFEGEFGQLRKLMNSKNPELVSELENVITTLNKIGVDAQNAGYTFALRDNYFPRWVKDYDGLLAATGREKEIRGIVDKAVQNYAKQKGINELDVPESVRIEITNGVLSGRKPIVTDGKVSFSKQRVYDVVPMEAVQKYYASPTESIQMYIRRMTNDIERQKFFGKYGEGFGDESISNSIGNIVTKMQDDLTPQQQLELRDMLEARFITGEKQMNSVLSAVRATDQATTIGNPFSAITQLGDLANSAFANGVRNTIKTLVSSKEVKVGDLGLDDVITKEIGETINSRATQALGGILKVTGFRKLDRLGKETFINGALNRFKGLSGSDAGRAKIREKYGTMFDDEIENLIGDLQNGKITDNVKTMLFSELSDYQPISLSEMPAGYLKNPNGRLFYTLKSFTIKQIDIARREIVQKAKTAKTAKEKYEVAKKATRMATLLAGANVGQQTIKDMLMGREVAVEDIPDKAIWSLLGVYGGNKFTADALARSGDISDTIVETVRPPLTGIQTLYGLGTEVFEDDPNFASKARGIPVIGNVIYNYFGGGLERYEQYREREKKKESRGEGGL